MSLHACEQDRRKLVGHEGGYWQLLAFLSFCRLSLSFLETVRGHDGAAAGGGNGYNQSYFEAKN